jgi:hypothetical protein
MHVNPECSSASHIVRQAQLSKYSNFSKLTIKGKKASVKTHLEHQRFTHLADILPLIPPMLPASSRYLRLPRILRSLDDATQ